MFKCIIVAEGDCDGDVYEFETKEKMEGFKEGVSAGAGQYGCGSCSAVSIEDLKHLNPNDEFDVPYIEAINEFLKD